MKCHDRVAFSKLHQLSCGLGFLRLDNVYHVFAYRYILDVNGFEVLGSFAFAFVIHFTQQIRDLITHHTATARVRVDEQGPFGGTQDILERMIQIDESPVNASTHLNVVVQASVTVSLNKPIRVCDLSI